MSEYIASVECSENPELCCFPKGCYFDYVTLFKEAGKFLLVGKGRYGCVTRIYLSEKQATDWIKRKDS